MKQVKIPETVKEQTAMIRRIIKRVCPTVSIRMGKGTAYGWVDIVGSGLYNRITVTEQKQLKKLGIIVYKTNCEIISPEERPELLKRLLNA